jgi:hypothetical protein
MNLELPVQPAVDPLTPFWENRANVSGQAGITGNDQAPTYWGPPTLSFTSGVAALTDGKSSFTRNETNGDSYVVRWNHFAHNVTAAWTSGGRSSTTSRRPTRAAH